MLSQCVLVFVVLIFVFLYSIFFGGKVNNVQIDYSVIRANHEQVMMKLDSM